MEVPEPSRPVEPDDGARDELWLQVLEAVRSSLRREQFETWFLRTALVRDDGVSVCIAVTNGFTRDWLQTYYLNDLTQALEKTLGSPRRIEMIVDPERVPAGTSPLARPEEESDAAPAPAPPREDGQRLMGSSDITLHAKYRFDNFVVGPCNRFAHAACVGVAETTGHRATTRCSSMAASAWGKTHLLQSRVPHDPGAGSRDASILFLSCETFVNHFISALEDGDLQAVPQQVPQRRSCSSSTTFTSSRTKVRTQEEFFHTFNTLYNAGKQIVLSSDRPPGGHPHAARSVWSRVSSGGSSRRSRSPATRRGWRSSCARAVSAGQDLPDDVARLLAERHRDSNIRELEGAVNTRPGLRQHSADGP